MIDALINDGDIVLMQQVSTVENGETAAVWLKSEKEVTLKKVYREKERIRLQPANSQLLLALTDICCEEPTLYVPLPLTVPAFDGFACTVITACCCC